MTFLSKLFASRSATRRPTGSCRPLFEALESRELLSASPLTPPNDLHNATIKSVARTEFLQDQGQLTRADVINLLGVVDGTEKATFNKGKVSFTAATPKAGATLSSSELKDLQTLVTDASAWGLTGDVTNLLGKVVNQNVANEHYQGNPLLSSGQLTAGTNDAALQDLVGKWFLGTDLPDLTAAVNGANIPDTVVYKTAKGTLFGPSGPSNHDIAQGWLGDCYFMSTLGETAVQSPQSIQNMFIDNHDGTYTVRFFEYDSTSGNWVPDYVTVNKELPVLQSSGQFAFANWYQGGKSVTYTNKNVVLWVALAEKAYAQLAEEGWSRSTNPGGSGVAGTPADWNQNCYDALNGGSSLVGLQQVTGATNYYDVYLPTATKSDEKALVAAFQSGDLVTIGSLTQEPSGMPTGKNGAPAIIATHVYFLKSVDLKHDKFTLVNPLDDQSYYRADGERTVTLTWAQLKAYLNDFVVMTPPSVNQG